ncbi:hypothetical protein HXT38_02045 [Gardnerella sp. DNF01157]|uniref:hypothetical protein n=1 Tax=Gardnerella TaxID=2701 RepID=UPI0039705C85
MANRHSAELARKVHWTFRLNKLTLRVAFARYALSAKAGRRASNSYLTQPLQKPASQTPAKNKKRQKLYAHVKKKSVARQKTAETLQLRTQTTQNQH